MWRIRLVPDTTDIPFLRWRKGLFVFSATLAVISVVLLFTKGLNFGIDFRGGILIEARTVADADIGAMRGALSGLGLGDVSLQEFGDPRDVLIRVEEQPGGEEAQTVAIDAVKGALAIEIGEVEYSSESNLSFRKTDE